MRVLLTNDDGIEEPGLLEFALRLRADGHAVVVAAPSRDVSGSGTSVGTIVDGAHIPVTTTTMAGLPNVEAYTVDAPPALAVLASGLGALGPRPDVVAVGVNPGHNTGRGVLHSSTVGAALAASSVGLRAVAVSCGHGPKARPDIAAQIGTVAVRWLVERTPSKTVLNVNVPDLRACELQGVRAARLGAIGMFSLMFNRDEGGLRLSQVSNEARLAEGHHPDTDATLIHRGFATVTPLHGGPRELDIDEDLLTGFASGIEQHWNELSALSKGPPKLSEEPWDFGQRTSTETASGTDGRSSIAGKESRT